MTDQPRSNPQPGEDAPRGAPLAPTAMTGNVTLGTGQVHVLASPGARLGARIIDGIIMFFAITLIGLVGFGGTATLVGDANSSAEVGAALTGFFGTLILMAVVGIVYEVSLIALKGQTVGKMATNVKIIRADNGDVPGWGKSIGRWFLPSVLWMIPFLGWILGILVYVSLTWDDRRQGWHDKAAGTVAIRV